MDRPLGLLAELTYACPLHCPYCSNPLNLGGYSDELTTQQWRQVIAEAAQLGVLQLHLSGGEPLLRRDVVDIVRFASGQGMYTNLVTSASGLSSRRAEQLRAAGLDHVQISVQADERALSDRIAGMPSHQRKLTAARLVKKLGWPLTLNVVLHRHNIDRIGRILDLAAELGADRIELANTQYYGWALHNRDALLPSRAQLERAEAEVRAARMRLHGQLEMIYVIPDYYSEYPKPCMGGWGRLQLTVAPNGDVLPCPTAHTLPLPRASVREHSLAWIWQRSPLFQRFRGTDWMGEPCRSCARRDLDFGGCRCQAYQLTGDAARADPVCRLSPDHEVVAAAVRAASEAAPPRDAVLIPRPHPDATRPDTRPSRLHALRDGDHGDRAGLGHRPLARAVSRASRRSQPPEGLVLAPVVRGAKEDHSFALVVRIGRCLTRLIRQRSLAHPAVVHRAHAVSLLSISAGRPSVFPVQAVNTCKLCKSD